MPKVAGFSLHAGVAAKAHERKKRKHLCRYISRPGVPDSGCHPRSTARFWLAGRDGAKSDGGEGEFLDGED